jgi:VanZ family protein
LKELVGSWRSVAAWAVLILVATTVPIPDTALHVPVPGIDKLVHGVMYLVLGWLVGAALSSAGRRSAGAWTLGALGLAVFSLLDETHQLWLPARDASAADWAADVVGATIGLALGMIVWSALGETERTPPAEEKEES